MFQLTDAHVEELDAALVHAEARCDDVLDITRESFPLPTLGAELDRHHRRAHRRPRRGAHPRRARRALRQGARVVDLLGHRDAPRRARGRRTRRVICSATSPTRASAANDPTSRGNEIGGIAFPFHSDGSDLVGLFCLDAGASGGASVVANVVTIHNELVRTEPELAAELYAPFPYDLRGEQAPGAKPWYTMPIFNRRGDRLFVRYIRPYIESTRRHDDAPRPSDAAREAMDRVDAMCADPQYHVAMMMQPGDMQFVNNYHVLHARDALRRRPRRPAGSAT